MKIKTIIVKNIGHLKKYRAFGYESYVDFIVMVSGHNINVTFLWRIVMHIDF